jgi:hypothetical protein
MPQLTLGMLHSLKTVYDNATTPQTIDKTIFTICNSLVVKMPDDGSTSTYVSLYRAACGSYLPAESAIGQQ